MIFVINKENKTLVDCYQDNEITLPELADLYNVDKGNLYKTLNNKNISTNSTKKLNSIGGFYFFKTKNKKVDINNIEFYLKKIFYYKENPVNFILDNL